MMDFEKHDRAIELVREGADLLAESEEMVKLPDAIRIGCREKSNEDLLDMYRIYMQREISSPYADWDSFMMAKYVKKEVLLRMGK